MNEECRPEGYWDKAVARYSISIELTENSLYKSRMEVMVKLIDQLKAHGMHLRYFAVVSHELLLIKGMEHRDLICAPTIKINPVDASKMDCRFLRAKDLSDDRATDAALNCDLDAAEKAVLRMTSLLERYREEIPPDPYNIPPDWYLDENDGSGVVTSR